MPDSPSILITLRCHLKRHLSNLKDLGDESRIWEAPYGVCDLVCSDHHVTNDSRKIDLLIVEDVVNQICGVIYQNTPFCCGEDVVGKNLV